MAYQRRDIFLHFLNRDSRQIYGLFREFESLRHGVLLARALNAAAILCETRCLAPPGFIIECDIAQAMMERKSAYLRERLVELPMREESLTDLVEKKREEYAPMRASYEGLFDDQRVRFLADNASGLIRRKAVIGANIANNWRAGPDENKRLWRPVTTIVPAHSIDSLRMIPEQLIENGTAATWPIILGLLPRDATQAEKELRRVLQHDYFSLYAREFRLVVVRNIPFMQDDFGLRSEPKIYDYEWLRTCFDQVRQSLILDGSAEAILFLRKQHGFIRFVDAYAGLCANCATITDLRFHMDRFARTVHFPWERFTEFWQKIIPTGEYNLGEERAVELADALGGVAARIEMSFSLSMRASTNQKVPSADSAVARVRTAMGTDNPELVIFVALEEEFQILRGRWNLHRAFVDFAARGAINEFAIDVVCARDMGRVPAAVAIGLYLAKRQNDPPRLVLTVGLAGGFQEEGIEEGMIIIPHTVVDLATRKIGDRGDQTTTEFRRRDFALDQLVYEYVTSSDFDQNGWQQLAIKDGDWPNHRRPSFHRGSITSLDEVVSSATWQKTLLDNSPKLLGVEMEAGGICAVAERYKVPVAMIRAVSDKADPAKVDTQWRSRGIKTIATLIEAIEWSAIIQQLKAK